MLISRQVTKRIRSQHHKAARALDRLERAARVSGDERVMLEATSLSGQLRDHFGLVSAVLDAVSEDEPDLPPRGKKPASRRTGD